MFSWVKKKPDYGGIVAARVGRTRAQAGCVTPCTDSFHNERATFD